MRQLIQDLIPHAPQMGLYVSPDIPEDKLRSAIGDYADGLNAEDVLALYDATLLGNGKDGALFTRDLVVFQNNDMEEVHRVRYADVVGVDRRRKLLGGRRVVLKVNRGRATFDLTIDFSGRPKASDYVARFLKEVMLREEGGERRTGVQERAITDVDAVRAALDALLAGGSLSKPDRDAMLRALGSRESDPASRS
jgi:hypothetical protein